MAQELVLGFEIALKEEDRALVFDLCVLDGVVSCEDIGESLEGFGETQTKAAWVFVSFDTEGSKVAESSVADHHEMRGVFFEFAEDVGGNDQGDAFALELEQEAGEDLACFGVESGGGFIKEKDFGVVDDGLSDGKALTETA